MEIVTCELPACSVIGIEGRAEPGHNPAPALWEAANARFGEVEALALRDGTGMPVGIWGAMSDLSRQFLPWTDGFSRGLYLAGVQVPAGVEPPEGWTKWTLPAFACLRVKAEGDCAAAFRMGLEELGRRGLTLAGAVQECQCPAEGGQLYLFSHLNDCERKHKEMRLFLAIVVCKVLRFVGGLMGKGSSLPGQYALKLCPDVLGRVRLPAHIIAVTGSNGKTSTVEMIAEILKQDGRKVVYNKEGSNQIEGVATLILSSCSLGGRVRGDVLLLESDERYAKLTFRWFHPTHFIITNLYRDQLTRNGHPEWVYDAIKPAIFPETTLILNADDPLVSCFARDHDPAKVKWFGLDQCPVSTREHRGVYHDGARCPVCRGRMEYACYHYAHIGHYACPACGHRRHSADFAVTALDLKAGRLTINGETDISLAFKSIYNVYNILAAWSACAVAGVSPAVMAGVIDNYLLKNGRMITFRLGRHRGTLLTSKHENSVAYDTNLAYIADSGKPCAVLVLVDSISRKYFTGETSWLWDIDFDRLNVPHVEKILLYGKYCNDLAVRFKYSQIPADRVQMGEDVGEGLALLRESGDEDIYAVTCFSDRDKLLACVDRD